MKAQLSLELMLYAALAGVSFVFVLGPLAKEAHSLVGGASSLARSQFLDLVNAELFERNTAAFRAFVPPSMCNSTVSDAVLFSGKGKYPLAMPLALSSNALCPDGSWASLRFAYDGAGAYLSRV
ncbi:Uncharacterised protein [uncultured archaeon]|nr:Uncharacterised protein [uncultured archaeon]